MLKLLTLSEDQPAWPTARQTPASAADAAPSLLLHELLCGELLHRNGERPRIVLPGDEIEIDTARVTCHEKVGGNGVL